ncbi:MAG: GID complex subunit 4, VID24 [Paramarteilia canceri]
MVESSMPVASVEHHVGDRISSAADSNSSDLVLANSTLSHLEINARSVVLDQHRRGLKFPISFETNGSANQNSLPLFFSLGAHFSGTQRTKGRSHPVTVVIHDIRYEQNYVCGYLTIKGLTVEYPILTTFFDGEIIGPDVDFLTRKWQADFDTDLKHWGKFKEFEKYKKKFENCELDLNTIDRSKFLFMRWKEKFLVPCHHLNSIPGASFAGFYYICLDLEKATISGYYYHQSSEWFQCLDLSYVVTKTNGEYRFA